MLCTAEGRAGASFRGDARRSLGVS
jgi:hypothetical protein